MKSGDTTMATGTTRGNNVNTSDMDKECEHHELPLTVRSFVSDAHSVQQEQRDNVVRCCVDG